MQNLNDNYIKKIISMEHVIEMQLIFSQLWNKIKYYIMIFVTMPRNKQCKLNYNGRNMSKRLRTKKITLLQNSQLKFCSNADICHINFYSETLKHITGR